MVGLAIENSLLIMRALCWGFSLVYVLRFITGAQNVTNNSKQWICRMTRQLKRHPQDLVVVLAIFPLTYLVFYPNGQLALFLEDFVWAFIAIYLGLQLASGAMHKRR